MGVIWVDYPPMIYWAGTASSHLLGGMSEFSLRLPNALTAICLVLLTCAVASRWFDPRTGLWAGVLLLTFQQFVYEAINYRPDTLFSLIIAAGMFLYASVETSLSANSSPGLLRYRQRNSSTARIGSLNRKRSTETCNCGLLPFADRLLTSSVVGTMPLQISFPLNSPL